MNEIITIPNIVFSLGILSIMFAVFNYFRNPQIKSEKIDAVLIQRIDGLEKQITNIKDNDLHTLDIRLVTLDSRLNEIDKNVVRLSVILEERIPKKQ